jgi:cytochrome b involved in lipid metabolism
VIVNGKVYECVNFFSGGEPKSVRRRRNQRQISEQLVKRTNLRGCTPVWPSQPGRTADLDSVTHFHEYHPGGATIILANAGTDVS